MIDLNKEIDKLKSNLTDKDKAFVNDMQKTLKKSLGNGDIDIKEQIAKIKNYANNK